MFTGGASSDAWLVRRRPPAFAARKASTKLSGGSGASAASMPRPISSGSAVLEELLDHLQGDRGIVLAVHVGDEPARSRRSRPRPRSRPSASPSTMVFIGTPRRVCRVGLKNISR